MNQYGLICANIELCLLMFVSPVSENCDNTRYNDTNVTYRGDVQYTSHFTWVLAVLHATLDKCLFIASCTASQHLGFCHIRIRLLL